MWILLPLVHDRLHAAVGHDEGDVRVSAALHLVRHCDPRASGAGGLVKPSRFSFVLILYVFVFGDLKYCGCLKIWYDHTVLLFLVGSICCTHLELDFLWHHILMEHWSLQPYLWIDHQRAISYKNVLMLPRQDHLLREVTNQKGKIWDLSKKRVFSG